MSDCLACERPHKECICKGRCGKCKRLGRNECVCNVQSVNPNFYKEKQRLQSL